MSDDHDAELAALKPLVAQAALEGGIQINRDALKLFARKAREKGANAAMSISEIFKFVKAVAGEEPQHVGLAPAKPPETRRQRAIHDLERTELLADVTRRAPARAKEPKLSKATKQGLRKFGGAIALLDAINRGEAPAFLNETNVSEGE